MQRGNLFRISQRELISSPPEEADQRPGMARPRPRPGQFRSRRPRRGIRADSPQSGASSSRQARDQTPEAMWQALKQRTCRDARLSVTWKPRNQRPEGLEIRRPGTGPVRAAGGPSRPPTGISRRRRTRRRDRCRGTDRRSGRHSGAGWSRSRWQPRDCPSGTAWRSPCPGRDAGSYRRTRHQTSR